MNDILNLYGLELTPWKVKDFPTYWEWTGAGSIGLYGSPDEDDE